MVHLLLAATAVHQSFSPSRLDLSPERCPLELSPQFPAETAAPKVPPDLPLAVICFNEQTQTWAVGYLTLVNKDGSATYIAG
jgi:hypothetical protein